MADDLVGELGFELVDDELEVVVLGHELGDDGVVVGFHHLVHL